ncbi:SDR family NAD(P)-dependent oxidoreductase [Umezawaea endophytica]|uniref:SDR family oxidoreductase n=1 Tax=Umezawaea endophytica TaxID=1654476 RepID=A0A9X2ZXL3_9PSEU|nr:SDR family oxidoreductase [Umezawaea endophytica]MCS7475469.1 SDR family oxidoreductase [Umezawaea endophytica]
MTRVCVVSGSARGLGAAIAERMAEAGYAVVGLDVGYPADRDLSTLPDTATPGVHPIHGDVSDRAAVLELVDVVGERFGGVHVVVNNAAWIHYALLPDVEEETLDRMIAIGIKGMVWLSQGAAKVMGDDGGSIINITSITATTGFPKATMYGALKGAGASMTRQLAVELAPVGIRVNAIAPGFIPTPGSLTVVDQAGVDRRESRTPLRLATPRDIADAVVFLASDQAGAITGQTLVVDGGLTVSL